MASLFKRPHVPLPGRAPDDLRIGHLLRRQADGAHSVLIGFPCDVGVRINGGRPGAAQGPEAIRRRLFAMTPAPRHVAAFGHTLAGIHDLGDLVLSGQLAQDQALLGEVVGGYLKQHIRPIILGGGHETAYGHFLGYVAAGQDVAIVNFDAHTDVRELKEGSGHSGSSFRQALEHPSGHCRRYSVAGLSPTCVSAAHLEYVTAHGGRCVFADALSTAVIDEWLAESAAPLMTTFCLDALDQGLAPGVSAPSANGLDAKTWLHAAWRAGRARVASLDIAELNPRLDRDEQTARLAAHTLWSFFLGLAQSA